MRMQIRQLTRFTNAFSKKWENHWTALCLRFAWYNFVRIHSALRVTPVMQEGIVDRVWDIGDLLSVAASIGTRIEKVTSKSDRPESQAGCKRRNVAGTTIVEKDLLSVA